MKHWQRGSAILIPLLVLLPTLRSILESSMMLHMLLVFPLLVMAGGGLVSLLPHGFLERLKPWNANGIPGLLLVTGVLTVWMIPLALDRAVESLAVDVIKTLSFVMAGMLLVVSLRWSTRVIQVFFVWNWVGMTIFIGVLYQSLPVRLCTAYLINDQELTGLGMVIMAAVFGAAWCVHAWRGYQQELQQALPPQ